MRFLAPRHALGALLALALFFCVTMAWAGSVTLTWTQSASPGVTHNTVYRGPTCTALAPLVKIPAATSYVDTTAPAGSLCYVVTAWNAGGESAASAPATANVPVPPPLPPTGLSVTAVVAGLNMSPAYRINADGTRGTTVLGFVPTGTTCAGAPVYTYRGVTYARVDPTKVKWWGTSPTPNVAAPCRSA